MQQKKKLDVKKENISALHKIDYAGLRDYSIAELLKDELTITAFFLMKDEYLRKCEKHELAKEIEKELDVLALSDVPRSNHTTMILIDFMASVHRVPVAKLKLATSGAFFEHLWGTFINLSRECKRIYLSCIFQRA